jgi:hypothetical protein
MSKAIVVGTSRLLLVLIIIGLSDLFRDSNALVAPIALIFSVVGIFNTRSALKDGHWRRDLNQAT